MANIHTTTRTNSNKMKLKQKKRRGKEMKTTIENRKSNIKEESGILFKTNSSARIAGVKMNIYPVQQQEQQLLLLLLLLLPFPYPFQFQFQLVFVSYY